MLVKFSTLACRSALIRELERIIEINRQELKKLGVKLVDDSVEEPKPARRKKNA